MGGGGAAGCVGGVLTSGAERGISRCGMACGVMTGAGWGWTGRSMRGISRISRRCSRSCGVNAGWGLSSLRMLVAGISRRTWALGAVASGGRGVSRDPMLGLLLEPSGCLNCRSWRCISRISLRCSRSCGVTAGCNRSSRRDSGWALPLSGRPSCWRRKNSRRDSPAASRAWSVAGGRPG